MRGSGDQIRGERRAQHLVDREGSILGEHLSWCHRRNTTEESQETGQPEALKNCHNVAAPHADFEVRANRGPSRPDRSANSTVK